MTTITETTIRRTQEHIYRTTNVYLDINSVRNIILTALDIPEEEYEIVSDYTGENGEGYVIESGSQGFRYVWRELADDEPDEFGPWLGTLDEAATAAWLDWDINGLGHHWASWCERLAEAAGVSP